MSRKLRNAHLTKLANAKPQTPSINPRKDNSYAAIGTNINNMNLLSVLNQQNDITNSFTTVLKNTDTVLMSNNRVVLSYLYTKEGIVQTLIDQPVDDGFRGGLEINSGELTQDEIQKVYNYIDERNILKVVAQAKKWIRLFGGGGIVISQHNTSAKKEFKVKDVKQGEDISFYAADLWELNMVNQEQFAEQKPYVPSPKNDYPYNFYGVQLHKSRVLKLEGKEAPSQVRQVLRGWGMSEVEKVLRPLANYYKLDELTANYIDQGKIDVFKFEGMNEALLAPDGDNALVQRVMQANMLKSKFNGIALDSNDDFVQKQISFSGVPEFKLQNRIEMASALKMPMTKIFGISSAGFNSGEDDLENYNCMVESEIRTHDKKVLVEIYRIVCQIVLGKYVEDIQLKFKPLRLMKGMDEQNMKSIVEDRLIRYFDRGILSKKQVREQSNVANLTPIEVDPEGDDEITRSEDALPPQKPTLDLYGDDSKQRNKLFNSLKNNVRNAFAPKRISKDLTN